MYIASFYTASGLLRSLVACCRLLRDWHRNLFWKNTMNIRGFLKSHRSWEDGVGLWLGILSALRLGFTMSPLSHCRSELHTDWPCRTRPAGNCRPSQMGGIRSADLWSLAHRLSFHSRLRTSRSSQILALGTWRHRIGRCRVRDLARQLYRRWRASGRSIAIHAVTWSIASPSAHLNASEGWVCRRPRLRFSCTHQRWLRAMGCDRKPP
jgi:hypothetical protein